MIKLIAPDKERPRSVSVTMLSQGTSVDSNTVRLTWLRHNARNNYAEGAEEPEKVISMCIDLPACAGSRKIHDHESNKSAL